MMWTLQGLLLNLSARRNRSKNDLRVLLFLLCTVSVAAIALLLGCAIIRQDPQARQKQEEIEGEFRLIQPPTGAVPTATNLRFVHKSDRGVVGLQYRTDLSYSAIRRHYDSELAKHGWKFEKDINVVYRGEDSGGKEAFYSKGAYTAILQFAGQRERTTAHKSIIASSKPIPQGSIRCS